MRAILTGAKGANVSRCETFSKNFPPLENRISNGGNFTFQERKKSFPRVETNLLESVAVLFLKKVHSWEGITEMVHGLFLLVL